MSDSRKLLEGLVCGLAAAFVAASLYYLRDYEVARHAWFFCVFWICFFGFPRIILQALLKRQLNATLVLPTVVISGFAVFFDYGQKMVILGVGVGLTYLVALYVAGAGPGLWARASKLLLKKGTLIKDKDGAKHRKKD